MPSSGEDGEWSKRVPFTFRKLKEVAGAGAFDTSQTKADTPTLYFDDLIPDTLKSGFINRLHFRIKAANPVTFTLRIWSAAIANDYESNMNMLYESMAVRVSDTDYEETELDIPFILADAGKLYYSLEWSGATGNVQGFIEASGETYE